MDVRVEELEVDAKSKPKGSTLSLKPWTTRSLVQNLSDTKSNSKYWFKLRQPSSPLWRTKR